MNAVLVKIDVACADLQVGVRVIERMVDGGDLVTRGLVWVFDLANDHYSSSRRELRFWRTELLARASKDSTKQHKYGNWELDWVIAQILPTRRKTFQAGEVDQLFQIRHNTRLAFGAELNGNLRNGANTYDRENLASFLRRRWLGNCFDRRQGAGAHFAGNGVGLNATSREQSPAVRPSPLKSPQSAALAGNANAEAATSTKSPGATLPTAPVSFKS
jgi:hypothetical protein